MNQVDSDLFPSPPNLINSLTAGLEIISQHVGLIIFSVIFDFFLWFGPQLRVQNIIQSFVDWTQEYASMQAGEMSELLEINGATLRFLGERFNLVASLRTFPIGIPSLLMSKPPIQNPIGYSTAWQVPSLISFLSLLILFTISGLIIGTFYFDLISQAAVRNKISWKDVIRRFPWNFSQVFLLSFLWLGILLAVSIPLSCIMPLMLTGSVNIGILVLIGYAILLLWILLPMVFAPHGIFIYRYRMWESVVQSARITRFTLPTTIFFLCAIIVISLGMDFIWKSTADTSWLTSIAIVGHALITTSLIAASFIYYRDAKTWMERLIQKSKLSSIST